MSAKFPRGGEQGHFWPAVYFANGMIRYMGIDFPRNFITTAKHVVVVEAIKYLEKYMTMRVCLILACEKEVIYM